MIKPVDPVALFRLTVIGPLVSRQHLEKGELKALIAGLAKVPYEIPGSKHVHMSPKTIERWYYQWKKHGVEGLAPKKRIDKGSTHLPEDVQAQLMKLKREQPSRSINMLIRMLEQSKTVAKNMLSRSSVHRFLASKKLSRQVVSDGNQIERRAFEAKHAGDIWYGDVMHGPQVTTSQGQRKTYLVSLMDDASRLICHSAFYLSETAVSIEHALKEAILKRGMPRKFVLDNGSAYRAGSLQSICARLDIRLVYCRPYEPEGKGKLERWHRTLRHQFLTEIDLQKINNLSDLNSRLWVWLEHEYHQRSHDGLADDQTPLSRWQHDRLQVRQLGPLASEIDQYFYHRVQRTVRRDATISWEGAKYEVPYPLVGHDIYLVIDPLEHEAKWVESLDYERLGDVCLLNKSANLSRRRQRPVHIDYSTASQKYVEQLYEDANDFYDITNTEF